MKEPCLKCQSDAVWEMHSLDVEDLEGSDGAAFRYYCDKHLKKVTGNLYVYNENGFGEDYHEPRPMLDDKTFL